MASQAWKAIERAVADLTGGTREWGSDDDVDVVAGDYCLEVKYLKAPTIADLERFLIHNQPKANGRGLKNGLIVKRKAGRGRPSPFLAVIPLSPALGDKEN